MIEPKSDVSIVIFDIGNVLIRWDPRNLYRQLFDDEAAMEHFLATVCNQAWNEEQDRGRQFGEGVALLAAAHPGHADLIRAYDERWDEMVPGAIDGSVAVFEDLRKAGVRTFAITNFSNEKFAVTQQRFPFLGSFEDIVVSAREGLMKPEPAIYHRLLDRNGLSARDCVFIDDSHHNVEGARAVGMQALHFTDPAKLRTDLKALGLPGV